MPAVAYVMSGARSAIRNTENTELPTIPRFETIFNWASAKSLMFLKAVIASGG